VFKHKVFNQGPTLIILKTTEGAICGGYTSKNWDGSHKWIDDSDAFVFNLTHRYNCINTQKAIHTDSNGYCFGNCIL
jgi:TLD